MDATERLTWDDESLGTHGVEIANAKVTVRRTQDGEDAWTLAALLENADGSEDPMLLAVDAVLVDSDGLVLDRASATVRPGKRQYRGQWTVEVSLVVDAWSRSTREECQILADVRQAGPHHLERPLILELSSDSASLAAAGLKLKRGRATCSSARWTGEIQVTVALRLTVNPNNEALVYLNAVDGDGLPVNDDSEFVLLDRDPDSPGYFVAARTFEVRTVPARIMVSPPRVFPDLAFVDEGITVIGPDGKKVLPDLPDEAFEADVKADPAVPQADDLGPSADAP